MKYVPVLVLALAACGGGGDSPTDPMPNHLCPFVLSVTPVAGFPGLYTVSPDPPGSYSISVNGVSRTVESGALVTASTGNVVQGCRDCGCSPAVVVR